MRGKSTSAALFASAFLASYSLFYLTGERATYSHGFDPAVEQTAFDHPAASPVEYLAFSQRYDADMERLRATVIAEPATARPMASSAGEAQTAAADRTVDPQIHLASLDPEVPLAPAAPVAIAPVAVAPVTAIAPASTTASASLEPVAPAATPRSVVPAAPSPIGHPQSALAPVVAPNAPAVTPNARSHVASAEAPPARASEQASLGRSLDPNVDRISFDSPTLAPMAFMRFCLRYADDCQVQGIAFRAAPVALTEARRAELTRINRAVNRAINPQPNLEGVTAEEWLINPPDGDCNDYAVSKRHELLALGWPSRALLLAEVVVPSGEHHLILIVRGKEDDLVLDNLNWNVRSLSQIRYQLVRIQQANNPKFWSSASVSRAAHVAMNTRPGRGS